MRTVLPSLLGLFWLSLASTALAADTSLSLTGDPGDYIVGNQHLFFESTDGAFTASRNSSNGVSVSFHTPLYEHWWYLDFAAPGNQPLSVGLFQGATRFPFQASTVPGLSLGGDGRGCNTLTGSFQVKQISFGTGDTIDAFWATFEQHCEGAQAAATGEIRFNANVVVSVTAPMSSVIVRGQTLTFTVTATDANAGHVQLSATGLPPGSSFVDDGDGSGQFTWTPAIDQTGTTHLVTFHVANGLGGTDDTSTSIEVRGLTSLSLTGAPGDSIVGNQHLFFGSAVGMLTASRNFDNGVSLSFHTPGYEHWWYLDFAAPGNQPLSVGLFQGATRFPFQASTVPGLSLSGDGRGCNTLTGSFEVKEVRYRSDGGVDAFWAVFEQHCEGAQAAATGEVHFSSSAVEFIVISSGNGSGTVTSQPDGIQCGADCDHGYAVGAAVTLTAAPAQGSVLSGWSGGGCSGTGVCSVTMNADFSVTASFSTGSCAGCFFTDETLTTMSSVIRSVHITELRTRINAVRVARGLLAFSFTDSDLSGTSIKAIHVTELRTALVAAYVAAGQPSPSFTDPSLTVGSTFAKVAHITELRTAVRALE